MHGRQKDASTGRQRQANALRRGQAERERDRVAAHELFSGTKKPVKDEIAGGGRPDWPRRENDRDEPKRHNDHRH